MTLKNRGYILVFPADTWININEALVASIKG